MAGGTDLVVAGGDSVRVLIDITRAGLTYIRRKGKAVAIGATKLSDRGTSQDSHPFRLDHCAGEF